MRKQVCWLIVEASLSMVYYNNAHIFSLNLGDAEQRFHNLKKRFSKKESKVQKWNEIRFRKSWDKTGRDRTQKYDFLSWLALYLRLKKNTGNNIQNSNVAEINPNNNDMTEAEENSVIAPKRAYFWVFWLTIHLKLCGKNIAKRKSIKKKTNKLQKNQARS